MTKVNYYTHEGLEKLKAELDHMIKVERPKISDQIAEARDKGDLSENAEYDAAKEAQGILEAKIAKMKAIVANARVIDKNSIDSTKIHVLSTVTMKNLKTNKSFTYTLVAENEANIKENKISIESPIGKGLLGHELGDIAEIETPAGVIKFEILNLE